MSELSTDRTRTVRQRAMPSGGHLSKPIEISRQTFYGRCSNPTRAQNVFLEDVGVCSIDFDQRYVIAPEDRRGCCSTRFGRRVSFSWAPLHDGVWRNIKRRSPARSTSTTSMLGSDVARPSLLPRQFTANPTIAAFHHGIASTRNCLSRLLWIVMQMKQP